MTTKAMIDSISKMDKPALDKVLQAVIIRRDQLAQFARLDFKVGDKVYFDSTRPKHGGRRFHGEVVKIARKNIQVRTSDPRVLWTVGATLLHHEEEDA